MRKTATKWFHHKLERQLKKYWKRKKGMHLTLASSSSKYWPHHFIHTLSLFPCVSRQFRKTLLLDCMWNVDISFFSLLKAPMCVVLSISCCTKDNVLCLCDFLTCLFIFFFMTMTTNTSNPFQFKPINSKSPPINSKSTKVQVNEENSFVWMLHVS